MPRAEDKTLWRDRNIAGIWAEEIRFIMVSEYLLWVQDDCRR